jgi:hypothetical protein
MEKFTKHFKKIYKDFINELKKKHQKENNNGTVLNIKEKGCLKNYYQIN